MPPSAPPPGFETLLPPQGVKTLPPPGFETLQPPPRAPASTAAPSAPGLAAPADGSAARPMQRKAPPCETVLDFNQDGLDVRVVNKACRGTIVGLRAWREDGKTKVQFRIDNKGGGTEALRLAEAWSDARGRAIAEMLDEQRISLEAGRSRVVVLTGPVPQATSVVLSLSK